MKGYELTADQEKYLRGRMKLKRQFDYDDLADVAMIEAALDGRVAYECLTDWQKQMIDIYKVPTEGVA